MQQPQEKYRYHLWLPDLFNATGGIQRYSSFCLQAISALYPNCKYNIFIKHDTDIPVAYPHLHFYSAGHWPQFLRTPAFATQLISFGLWQRPNLIFSTHLNFSVAAYRLKQLAGIPYWVVAHGIEAWNIQNQALKTALKYADRIISVSNYTRDRLIQQNFPPDKIIVLPNTFDSRAFQIAPKPDYLLKRYGLNSNQKIILTVGRLSASEQYKGYDKIIAALPEIKKAIPNVHYILIGKGDDQPRIKRLISQLKLQNNVTLTGFVPEQELCDHYNLCDVFAMPSQQEGFGIVYLEALACGKPTLGGNKDAATDALCHGQLGALVNPDDISEITQTLMQILQGSYHHSLIYQPETLRNLVIQKYGFTGFKRTLFQYLHDFNC
jgi:glycosyltransferase involved in cell wall biosynthesis